MTYGLTSAGFNRKRYADIITEKEARARELFGENVNLTPSSPLARFITLNAWEEAQAWELAEDVYNSAYVDTSEGNSLDHVAKYIGISRQPATAATGTVTFTGDDDTVIPADFKVSTAGGIEYTTDEEGIIAAGEVEVDITAVETGTEANVPGDTITEIINPISGVDDIDSSQIVAPGRNRETDSELRARYERSVAQPGSSTAASIAATILNIEGVIDVIVRQNVTMTEVDNIPAKSIAPMVYGGDDEEIAEAIFAVKAGGIQSAAVPAPPDAQAVEITVTDEDGEDHVIGFARPELVDIYVNVVLDVDANYPADGDDLVAEIILEYITALGLGEDVIYTRMIADIQQVPGTVDITTLQIDVTPLPTGTSNISISDGQIAAVSADDVDVSSS